MKPLRFAALILISAALMLAACGSLPASQPATAPVVTSKTNLVIAGSGGAATVLKYLAEAYGSQHPEMTFEFLSGSSSGGGATGVLDGTLDLGTMSRPPKDSELAGGIKYLAFSNDRVAIVTSPDLSISKLTSQQVKDIFLGNITNWSVVGGPDATISLLVRDEEESSTQILRSALFGDAPFAPGSVVFTSDADMRDALSEVATNTIAFLGYNQLRLSDLNVKALVIDGQDPAEIGGDYPYLRPMGVAYLPSNAAKLQPFLDFISSPEAMALLAEKGISPPK